MDKVEIIKEWFYRLPKGYAEAPYTKKEMDVLHTILEEEGKNGSVFITEVDQLDQAFHDAEPVEEAEDVTSTNLALWEPMEQQLFDEKVFSEAGTYQDVIDFARITFLKLGKAEAKQVALAYRKQSVAEFVDKGWKTFTKFMAFDRKGFGRGELATLMGIQGSQSGGTAEHDLKVGGTTIEVKEVVGNTIRPAKSGMAARMPWSKQIRSLYQDAVEPMASDTYMREVLKLLFPKDAKLQELMDMFADGNEFSNVSKKGTTLFGADGVERGADDMNSLYQGLIKAQQILTNKFLEDKSITAMKLLGATQGKFAIGDKDAEKLQSVPVTGKEVTLDIVPIKASDTEEANLWLYNLSNHPWVKNPQLYVNQLVQARDIYFASIPSGKILWFQTTSKNKTPKKLGISEKDEWYTTHITQGQFRFAPKSLYGSNADKYEHVIAQKGL
jgi:hypothetical protein